MQKKRFETKTQRIIGEVYRHPIMMACVSEEFILKISGLVVWSSESSDILRFSRVLLQNINCNKANEEKNHLLLKGNQLRGCGSG